MDFVFGEEPNSSRFSRLKICFKGKIERCRRALGVGRHKDPKVKGTGTMSTFRETETNITNLPYEVLELSGDGGRPLVSRPDTERQSNFQTLETQSHQVSELSGHECAVEMSDGCDIILGGFDYPPTNSNSINDLQPRFGSSYDTVASDDGGAIAMGYAFDGHKDSVIQSRNSLELASRLSVNFASPKNGMFRFAEQANPSASGFPSSTAELQQRQPSEDLPDRDKFMQMSISQGEPFQHSPVHQQAGNFCNGSVGTQTSKSTAPRADFCWKSSSLSTPSTSKRSSRYNRDILENLRASCVSDNRLDYSSTRASSDCFQHGLHTKDQYVHFDGGSPLNGISMVQRPIRPRIDPTQVMEHDQRGSISFDQAHTPWCESPASILTQSSTPMTTWMSFAPLPQVSDRCTMASPTIFSASNYRNASFQQAQLPGSPSGHGISGYAQSKDSGYYASRSLSLSDASTRVPFIRPVSDSFNDRVQPLSTGSFYTTSTSPSVVSTIPSAIGLPASATCRFRKSSIPRGRHSTHQVRGHGSQISHRCPHCESECTGKDGQSNLKRHIDSKHLGRVFHCRWHECKQTFNRFDNLQKHVKDIHLERLPQGPCLWKVNERFCYEIHSSHDSLKNHVVKTHVRKNNN